MSNLTTLLLLTPLGAKFILLKCHPPPPRSNVVTYHREAHCSIPTGPPDPWCSTRVHVVPGRPDSDSSYWPRIWILPETCWGPGKSGCEETGRPSAGSSCRFL